jgi:hypothetical protein
MHVEVRLKTLLNFKKRSNAIREIDLLTLCYQISHSIITISLHLSSILISVAVGRETLGWANMAKIKGDQKHVL